MKTLKAFLYVFLTFLFFLTWGMRNDELFENLPWIIHLGVFFLLFWGVTKIKTPSKEGQPESKEDEKNLAINVVLFTVSALMLFFLFCALFAIFY